MTRRLIVAAICTAGVLLAACASPETLPAAPGSERIAADPPIVGTTWHWFRTLDPERSWEAPDPTRYMLTLGVDGRAIVRADCNRGTATYTLQDGRLEFGSIAATKMNCAESRGMDGRYLLQLAGIRLVGTTAGMLRADLYADAGTMFFVAEPDAIYGSYSCAGGRLAWAVYTEDRARVVTGPDTFDLPIAISASGARYARDEVVWWVKGDGAFLEKDGVRVLADCVRTPPAS
jgi:heat shock protein HslJ/membrane-bound inhibitor of C-type lysozyme